MYKIESQYLKMAHDTFREHLIMQQHSETEENYSLNKHGKEVAAKVIPFEDISLVI